MIPINGKKIFVEGLYPTEGLLEKEETRLLFQTKFCAIISIIDKRGQEPPFRKAGLEDIPQLHTARFMDLDDKDIEQEPDIRGYEPQKEDIQSLISFLKDRIPHKGHIFVHCHMGYSRSPAAAIIAAHLVGANPEEAVTHILTHVAPRTEPNPLILKLADEILGLNPQSGLRATTLKALLLTKE